MTQIHRTTPIEELVHVPGAVDFMVRNGLPCLVCGEPAWGTFEDVARSRGRSPEEVELLLAELNRTIEGQDDAKDKGARGLPDPRVEATRKPIVNPKSGERKSHERLDPVEGGG